MENATANMVIFNIVKNATLKQKWKATHFKGRFIAFEFFHSQAKSYSSLTTTVWTNFF